ncbi:flagellar biosynthesis regulator FlaF [Microvirga thermotolerans]|uniref:Flagellar biosynthesis regulator FlaF n=1 Tax=Microvirga thermotolerans TaxID=2651334 RepID=A0A5P9JZR3_9HYPH|nr:flagellar biosynthesis regulator FlaF [Microvirga thermotolerans]QFU17651.1 flagellar biosynthesis regulator FlaF [Microvirga thermotolerans]
MYRFSYAEILEDASDGCRERERMAFDHAIDLLKTANRTDASANERSEAVTFVQRLWTVLIEDLMSPENGLPEALRAQLVSIGLWIMKEADLVRQGESRNFNALIEINTMIRDGLK